MLLLTLCTGEESVQSSIVQEAFYNGRSGIEAVAQPVKHFELTDVWCKTDEPIAEFHASSSSPGKDQNAVYYKLQDLRKQVCVLDKTLSEIDVTKRLVVVLGSEYQIEATVYRNSGMTGQRMTLQEFRTMIQHS